MLTIIDLKIGGVYQTNLSDSPVRILGFDEKKVFYDVWWSIGDWCCRVSLRSKVSFYRTSVQIFLATAELIRVDALNENEISIIRPDLPFVTLQFDSINWTSKNYSTIELFKNEFINLKINLNKYGKVYIPKVVLIPFGVKGGRKKASVVEAINGEYFESIELLWNAHNIQSTHITERSLEKGIGIYRLGFEKGMPSYYIWGNHDEANIY